jgi:hypothetical protein
MLQLGWKQGAANRDRTFASFERRRGPIEILSTSNSPRLAPSSACLSPGSGRCRSDRADRIRRLNL